MPTYNDSDFFIDIETNAPMTAEKLRKLEKAVRDYLDATRKLSQDETLSDKKDLDNKTRIYRQKDKQIRQEKELGRQQRQNAKEERGRISQNAKLLQQLGHLAGSVFSVKKMIDFGRGVFDESRQLYASNFAYGINPESQQALGFLAKKFGGNDKAAGQALKHLKDIAFLVEKGQNPISELGMAIGGQGIFQDESGNLTKDPLIILSNLARRMQELEKAGRPYDAQRLGQEFGLDASITSVLREHGTNFLAELRKQEQAVAISRKQMQELQATQQDFDKVLKEAKKTLVEQLTWISENILRPLAQWAAQNPDAIKKLTLGVEAVAIIGGGIAVINTAIWAVKKAGTAAAAASAGLGGLAKVAPLLVKILAPLAVGIGGFKLGEIISEKFIAPHVLESDTIGNWWNKLSGDEDRHRLARHQMLERIQRRRMQRRSLESTFDYYSPLYNFLDKYLKEVRSGDYLRSRINEVEDTIHTPLNSMNSNTINNLGNTSNVSNNAVTRVGTINVTAASSQPYEIAAAVERGLKVSDFAMLDYMNSGGFRV